MAGVTVGWTGTRRFRCRPCLLQRWFDCIALSAIECFQSLVHEKDFRTRTDLVCPTETLFTSPILGANQIVQCSLTRSTSESISIRIHWNCPAGTLTFSGPCAVMLPLIVPVCRLLRSRLKVVLKSHFESGLCGSLRRGIGGSYMIAPPESSETPDAETRSFPVPPLSVWMVTTQSLSFRSTFVTLTFVSIVCAPIISSHTHAAFSFTG